MTILSRYLMRAIIGHTLLVVIVLLVLSGLYLFVSQQDDVGVGTFGVDDAFWFALLSLPKYAFDLLPIASLIGALLALGHLARSLELIVIRTAGVSTLRIGIWVGTAGLVLMAVTAVLGEYIAPPLEQYARQMKMFEKFQDVSTAGSRSIWAKDGAAIVAVRQQTADNRYGGVYVFKFDERRRLSVMGHASNASIGTDSKWRLENYRESMIGPDRVVASEAKRAEVETSLSPEFLGLAVFDPESLPVRGLIGYMRHLRANGLDARAYETAFWARIARTVAVAIIVVLAVPFAFGPMRSTGTGARTVVGIMIGVAFFLLAKMLESGGAVFELPPFIIGWGPTIVLAIVTLVAIARVR
ncbi:MAG: LPS export ABC transporter permease LptG [Gammaproteobacteria bacterium]|nr:LPS export ABC transporter permease LptG [Gammaproteobacteria bacterium]